MDYLKIYNNLCSRGQSDRKLGYSEKHHILPKCIGGTDDVTNITILTSREHYIAHVLLVKIHPKKHKLLFALSMMVNSNEYQQRNISSKQYEFAKNCRSIVMRENNPMYNEETVKKALLTRNKKYESGELKTRKLSNEEKINISERMKGENNPTLKYPEKHNFKSNRYVLGKKCYNNGIVNKYFREDEYIPDGWVKGNKPYKRTNKQLNNDNEELLWLN